MNQKIVITTPYPTTEDVIRILGMTPADVAYVDRLIQKIGLPKPIHRGTAQMPVPSQGKPARRSKIR